MGVWIETDNLLAQGSAWESHPVWVCGLKPSPQMITAAIERHTLYGCVD